MTLRSSILVWLLLLGVLAAEFLLARTPGLQNFAPFVGLGMALIVAFSFMRLGGSRGLVPVFAVAGAFWLCVMLGLGSLDSATRRDIFTSVGHAPETTGGSHDR